MTMTKTLLSLTTAAAVGVGGLVATPQPAKAVVWWVAPAIIGGAILGAGVGAAAANSAPAYAYEPGPGYAYQTNVYVRPYPGYGCHIVRERVNGFWRRVRVCN